MDIRPLTPAEQKYTYAQSMQLEGQTGTIGHLRGDFATTGYGFYTTWFDTRPQWKSDEFKAELDTVINALREDKGLLHNRYDMSAFARHFPESAIKGNYCTEYGFRVDTEKHAFLLRCKYYEHSMQVQFSKHTLHSANLYQIFTYVKNKDYELRAKDHTVSGMLLYAKTDEEIYPNNVYQMSGNQITVRTLDLNLPFDEIAGQLNTIAKTHFDL